MGSSRKFLISLFCLTIAGLLFSGYLSFTKLLSGSCAFNESCPYFLGYPACWYGFLMYLAMFIAICSALLKKISGRACAWFTTIVSLLGILFAGSFVVQEIAELRVTGTLGLSTCAYGLIFYVAIFIISFFAIRQISHSKNGTV